MWHDLPPEAFRQRHGCDGIGSRWCRRLGQEAVLPCATEIVRGAIVWKRWGCLCGRLGGGFSGYQLRLNGESCNQAGSRCAMSSEKISSFHRFLVWVMNPSDPVDPFQRIALAQLQVNLDRLPFRQEQIAGGTARLRP